MKTNVEKVLERDQKLSELDDRADALQQGASQFEQQAGKLKRKFWLQNLKMMIIMGVIGLVFVAIIACEYYTKIKLNPVHANCVIILHFSLTLEIAKLGLIGDSAPPPPQYAYLPPPPPPPPAQPAAAAANLFADTSALLNNKHF